jgi:hypothetical protein
LSSKCECIAVTASSLQCRVGSANGAGCSIGRSLYTEGLPRALALINPLLLGISAAWPGLMLATVLLTGAFLCLAAWRLRPACAAQGAPQQRRRYWAWLGRPPVGHAPLRWKGRYVGELGLFAFARKVPCAALTTGLRLCAQAGIGDALITPRAARGSISPRSACPTHSGRVRQSRRQKGSAASRARLPTRRRRIMLFALPVR